MSDADIGTGPVTQNDIDADPAARGTVYRSLAAAFDYPSPTLAERLATGAFAEGLDDALDRTALAVDRPALSVAEPDRLGPRYNQLFEMGTSTVTDRTDGSVEREGPMVSLYESRHREASWDTINQDLARAYDYYGLGVDDDERDHHDHLRLELEFAGYLARRTALGDRDAARARRDFLDRHLQPFAASVAEDLADVDGVYAGLGSVLLATVRADRADLDDRLGETDDRSEVAW